MKTIVIANGDLSKQKIDFSEYDFIVATDGGANHLVNLKIKPDIIIGDFDSISKKAIKKFDDVEQIRVYNQNKTDLEKALDYLMEEKCEIVDIFGATSNERIDHTLANIFLLKNYSDLNIKIYSNNQTIEVIENKILQNLKGKTVSMFPLRKSNKNGIELTGFEWNKINDYSISNVIVNDIAKIKSNNKLILIINNKI